MPEFSTSRKRRPVGTQQPKTRVGRLDFFGGATETTLTLPSSTTVLAPPLVQLRFAAWAEGVMARAARAAVARRMYRVISRTLNALRGHDSMSFDRSTLRGEAHGRRSRHRQRAHPDARPGAAVRDRGRGAGGDD